MNELRGFRTLPASREELEMIHSSSNAEGTPIVNRASSSSSLHAKDADPNAKRPQIFRGCVVAAASPRFSSIPSLKHCLPAMSVVACHSTSVHALSLAFPARNALMNPTPLAGKLRVRASRAGAKKGLCSSI